MHSTLLAVLFLITGLFSIIVGFVRPHQFEEDYSGALYKDRVYILYSWYNAAHEYFVRTNVLTFTTVFLTMTAFMFTLEPLALVLAISEKIGEQYLIAPILICVTFQWVFVLGRLYANRSRSIRHQNSGRT